MIVPHYTTKTTSSLFYYFSINDDEHKTWVKEMIVENKIYFKTRDQLNDPYELKFIPSFGATTAEKIAKYIEFLKKTKNFTDEQAESYLKYQFNGKISENKIEEWEKRRLTQFQKSLDNTGIFCLSELPDNPLMWSHYADKHKGICLEFKVDVSKTPYILWNLGDQEIEPLQVKYVEDKKLPIDNFYNKATEEWVTNALLTKSKNWEYEKEWRIPLLDKGKGYRTIQTGLISGVILGLNTPPKDEEFVKNLLNKCSKDINLYKSCLIEGSYELGIKKL